MRRLHCIRGPLYTTDRVRDRGFGDPKSVPRSDIRHPRYAESEDGAGVLFARTLAWLVRMCGRLTEGPLQRLQPVADGPGVRAEVLHRCGDQACKRRDDASRL